jgi:SulP family sulfate permease
MTIEGGRRPAAALTQLVQHNLEAPGRELRVRSIERHTLVGEMGLYRAVPRGASVLVDQPTIVYRLSRDALKQMEADAPPLAVAFHKFVVRALADRLDFVNREVAALQE